MWPFPSGTSFTKTRWPFWVTPRLTTSPWNWRKGCVRATAALWKNAKPPAPFVWADRHPPLCPSTPDQSSRRKRRPTIAWFILSTVHSRLMICPRWVYAQMMGDYSGCRSSCSPTCWSSVCTVEQLHRRCCWPSLMMMMDRPFAYTAPPLKIFRHAESMPKRRKDGEHDETRSLEYYQSQWAGWPKRKGQRKKKKHHENWRINNKDDHRPTEPRSAGKVKEAE